MRWGNSALVLFFFCFLTQAYGADLIWTDAPSTAEPALSNVQIIKNTTPSVVTLFVKTLNSATNKEESKVGSGFTISADGYILTNFHVVENAAPPIGVIVSSEEYGQEGYDADPIALDPLIDVAVLKIHPSHPLPFLKLSSSRKVEKGDPVVVIGTPDSESFAETATTGIISGKDRIINFPGRDDQICNFFQTDAAANPGNSGGPVLNQYGDVIGILTAILPDHENINFLIPIDTVKRVISLFFPLSRRSLPLGYLGVEVRAQPIQDQNFMGPHLPLGGLIVRGVMPNGPAAAAGIQPSDIVVSVDGAPLKNSQDLTCQTLTRSAGDVIQLQILRDGKPLTITATLGSTPPIP